MGIGTQPCRIETRKAVPESAIYLFTPTTLLPVSTVLSTTKLLREKHSLLAPACDLPTGRFEKAETRDAMPTALFASPTAQCQPQPWERCSGPSNRKVSEHHPPGDPGYRTQGGADIGGRTATVPPETRTRYLTRPAHFHRLSMCKLRFRCVERAELNTYPEGDLRWASSSEVGQSYW